MPKYLKILLTFSFSIILLLGFTETANMVTGNWYQQFLPNIGGRQIKDITFLDSLTGFAITNTLSLTDTTFVLKTTNRGDSWFFNYYDSGVVYNRIQFINQNTGFIGGYIYKASSFHIVKTTNAGLTWFYINAPFDQNADDMFVLNQDTIWIADGLNFSGGVFRTTNAGVTWTLQYQGNNPGHIYMYNRNIGFISDPSGGGLYRTTNSGASWTQITGTDGFYSMYFADSLTGWKANGFMRKTTDGGLTWQTQTLPSGGIIISSGMGKFSIIGVGDTIWGVGGYVQYPNLQSRGTLYRTTNGGQNWLFQIPDTSIPSGTYYSYVQFVNSKVGWAYTLLTGIHTTNGGDTNWITGVKQISSNVPNQFKLYQNYPNPFNPVTVISYQLRVNSYVKMSVFDITGKHIIDLVNQKQNAGTYQVDFSGNNYSSGVYFYSLIVDGNLIDTKKMILLK